MQCIVLCIIIESILYLIERRSGMSHYHGRKISGSRQRAAQATMATTMTMAKRQ